MVEFHQEEVYGKELVSDWKLANRFDDGENGMGRA